MTVTDEAPDVDVEEPEFNPVKRDRWGRPYIVPPEGGEPVTYTRASTLAKALSDGASLTTWKQTVLLKGLSRQPTLLNGPLYQMRSTGELPKWEADRVIEAASEVGGANDASRWGTTLHGLTEFWDMDRYELPNLPPDQERALKEYIRVTEGYETLSAEGFVVCDELQAAGSYDRLYLVPEVQGIVPRGEVVIGDIKTGPKIHLNVTEAMIQFAVYAHSKHYDPVTGERVLGNLAHVNQQYGLLVQVPRTGEPAAVLVLDLVKGWELAKLAKLVRDSRIHKPLTTRPRAPRKAAAPRAPRKKVAPKPADPFAGLPGADEPPPF